MQFEIMMLSNENKLLFSNTSSFPYIMFDKNYDNIRTLSSMNMQKVTRYFVSELKMHNCDMIEFFCILIWNEHTIFCYVSINSFSNISLRQMSLFIQNHNFLPLY
jgi:hypothetical protein